MMALLLTVLYFVDVCLDQTQKLTVMAGHVLECAKRVVGIPDFEYYALVTVFATSSPGSPENTLYQ
jgi:hypothetical protein